MPSLSGLARPAGQGDHNRRPSVAKAQGPVPTRDTRARVARRLLILVGTVLLLGAPAVAHAEPESVLSDLGVEIWSAHEPFHRAPGYTNISLDGTRKQWDTTIVVRARGKIVHAKKLFGGDAVEVEWSCAHPGTVYDYVVSAEDSHEEHFEQRGTFKGASRWWCHEARLLEDKELRTHERQVLRELAALERKERETHQHEEERRQRELTHYEANCRAEGGIPTTLNVGGTDVRACRSQTGGLLAVPT